MSINQALWLDRVISHSHYLEERADKLAKQVQELEAAAGESPEVVPETIPAWAEKLLLTVSGQHAVSLSTTTEELLAMLAVARQGRKAAAQILGITLAIHCHRL